MKKVVMLVLGVVFCAAAYGQVAYVQYRAVPQDRESEFVENETKHWSKVAQSAIDNGQMEAWHLWEKIGNTAPGAPNYVIVNNFKNLESMDQDAVWSDENVKSMGVDPESVNTASFAPTVAEYWFQIEETVPGESPYVVVNYAKPANLGTFISENKELWKPMHMENVKNKNMGMTSWTMMSVVYPQGNDNKFSVVTIDGFENMNAALKYLRYQETSDLSPDFQAVIAKSKMDEVMPEGFEKRVLYRLIKRIDAEE